MCRGVGGALAAAIRILMVTSGVLALAGLSAVVVDDMGLRMIGVVGYAVILPVIALLFGIVFMRTETRTRSARLEQPGSTLERSLSIT